MKTKTASRFRLKLRGLVFCVILGFFGSKVPDLIWPDPIASLEAEFQPRMAAIPGLAERFAAAADRGRLGREMAMLGLPRLSDAVLIERAIIFNKILAGLDEHDCAEVARGRGDVRETAKKLEPATLRRWVEIVLAAVIAEHERMPAPYPNPSDGEYLEAILAVRAPLPDDQAEQFMRIGGGEGGFEGEADAHACWWQRTLFAGIPDLDGRHQRVIARRLVQR